MLIIYILTIENILVQSFTLCVGKIALLASILVETFFSNFNLDRTEALNAATLYSRHLAETTSRMNKANGLSTNCFGDETQHFFSLQQTNWE